MTAAAAAGLIGCGIFGAAMLHALVTDLRHRRIRNWMLAALAAIWPPMALAAGIPAAEMAAAAAAAALLFGLGFACFAAGWLGGGDVKLAALAVLWLGASQAVAFVLLTSVLGALLTGAMLLARLIRRPAAGPTARMAQASPGGPAPVPHAGAARPDPAYGLAEASAQVPYGPALAVAGLALLHASPWAAAL